MWTHDQPAQKTLSQKAVSLKNNISSPAVPHGSGLSDVTTDWLYLLLSTITHRFIFSAHISCWIILQSSAHTGSVCVNHKSM